MGPSHSSYPVPLNPFDTQDVWRRHQNVSNECDSYKTHDPATKEWSTGLQFGLRLVIEMGSGTEIRTQLTWSREKQRMHKCWLQERIASWDRPRPGFENLTSDLRRRGNLKSMWVDQNRRRPTSTFMSSPNAFHLSTNCEPHTHNSCFCTFRRGYANVSLWPVYGLGIIRPVQGSSLLFSTFSFNNYPPPASKRDRIEAAV